MKVFAQAPAATPETTIRLTSDTRRSRGYRMILFAIDPGRSIDATGFCREILPQHIPRLKHW
jgi:hypothetical protein